ncbi:hypothetical protein [Archangium sp.]|jgi:intracellular sulfur oxidation DsrE/DsrF family protein|uniref:hypothetical protein n=1 Tax=Archangium sp. TaxID=1872627 RepID=UPI002ED96E76
MTSAPGRLVASSLSLLLLSCCVARHPVTAPTGAQNLGRYVLILERGADGQMVHSWKPVEDFQVPAHSYLATTPSVQGRVVQAAFNRDCEGERDACERMCLAGLQGDDWSHMRKGAKKEHCIRACRRPYLDCCRLKELAEGEAVEFHATDEAIAWVKQNSDKLLAGAVIVIAGVAFVVVGGSGGVVLLLVPVVTLASSEVASEPRALAVTP